MSQNQAGVSQAVPIEDLTFEQRLRFRIIEIIALWEGRLTTNHLQNSFNIGRQQASRDINTYINDYAPDNLIYDRQLKGYKPTEQFAPRFCEGFVDEYLHLLHRNQELGTTLELKNLAAAGIELLDVPTRRIRPELMRALLQAAREQRRVDVEYQSFSNAQPQGRIIVPHTLVNDGIRWHLRAWCEASGDYRDFVLSRFRGIPELMEASPHGADDDERWQTYVDIGIRPNPHLSAHQQEIVEQDYHMTDGLYRFSQRAALVQYTLDRMQVYYGPHPEANPLASPLILANPEILHPYLIRLTEPATGETPNLH